ncbi:MAG: glycogen debranching protein GlgX [Desulfocapsaceae bacterium]|nr:glycogen debranching protein GlgX [Desulfocapsaceae bacterium]
MIPPQKRGRPYPLGPTVMPGGINFSLFSRHAEAVTLVIELPGPSAETQNYKEIALSPDTNKTGDIWHIFLQTDRTDLRYGYRLEGISGRKESGLVFDDRTILIDPYAPALSSRVWEQEAAYGKRPCCMMVRHDFNWQDDHPLKIPLTETIIYELHVRGFTRHPTSGVSAPGTYLGIIEKIPYLQALGVTAVELMPVAEFDENDTIFRDPETGRLLRNFWGYNPVSFFALKSGYAKASEAPVNEFKAMVLALHQAGIEVILDMVYNHTSEGGYEGTTTSFRGIDNPIYYLLGEEGRDYLNFSGCGNTMNCNHPVVRELIRSSLRYWVIEMHVDGFRFDLASILGRDKRGRVLPDPPMIEIIAEDPILRDTKIIAEAWDAAGLYQVGSFSSDARWGEWNGRFRDDVRSFMAGLPGSVTSLATRLAGSSDLYQSGLRGPCNSINFLTSHDGFTLRDLVSFNEKHNLSNGEENRDGDNHNISWNSGREGLQAGKKITMLRCRRIRSMAVILLLSQGVPMFAAGDEFGRSQMGNNNAWCQDSPISWLDWSLAEKNADLFRFFRECIQLRKSHTLFRREGFFSEKWRTADGAEIQEIVWQSLEPGRQDWSPECRTLGFLLDGRGARGEREDDFFIMLNGNRDKDVTFTVPTVPTGGLGRCWYKIIDSASPAPADFLCLDEALKAGPAASRIKVKSMAAVVLRSSGRSL